MIPLCLTDFHAQTNPPDTLDCRCRCAGAGGSDLFAIQGSARAARLLPESDGILYVHVGQLRSLLHNGLKPVAHSDEYQNLIDAIGNDPERDLEEVAIAVHRMEDPRGPNGPVAYSMVLVGKIDGNALARYLDAHATARETYDGHTIYSLPSEGRTVRVAQIGYDTVVTSNTPSPEQIHSMLDRHRTAALPFSGSTLLSEHYSEMPILSVAWGMGQIALPFTEDGNVHVLGMELPLPPDTTFLASLYWAGTVKLRVVEVAATQATAASQIQSLTALLALAQGVTAGLAPSPANNSLKEVLHTAQISQNKNRVVFNAALPWKLLLELLNGSGGNVNSNSDLK